MANNEWDLIISIGTWLYRRLHAESMPLIDWLCPELWNLHRESETANFQDTSFILISWMVLSMNGATDLDDLVLAFPARYKHSDAVTAEQHLCNLLIWRVIQSSIYQNFSPCKVLQWPFQFPKHLISLMKAVHRLRIEGVSPEVLCRKSWSEFLNIYLLTCCKSRSGKINLINFILIAYYRWNANSTGIENFDCDRSICSCHTFPELYFLEAFWGWNQ